MYPKKILPLTSTAASIKTTAPPTTTTEIPTKSTAQDSVLVALLRDQGPQAVGISLASLAYTALGKLIFVFWHIILISGPEYYCCTLYCTVQYFRNSLGKFFIYKTEPFRFIVSEPDIKVFAQQTSKRSLLEFI